MAASYHLERRVGELAAQAHPCDSTGCDIPAMLACGHWALAARTLLEGTDMPAGDPLAGIACTPQQPCRQCLPCAWDEWAASIGDAEAVGEFLDDEQQTWATWAEIHSATCPHCTSIVYLDEQLEAGEQTICGNCANPATVTLILTRPDLDASK